MSCMLVDVKITEKSFGSKSLMKDVSFSLSEKEKVGLIGRNGIGKSTLFSILNGTDTDFSGDIKFRRGSVVVSTNQEYDRFDNMLVIEYILSGLPEYVQLTKVINEYPEKMGSNIKMISKYTEALNRFTDKNYHYIEDQVGLELKNFQLDGYENKPFSSLSGGEKRLVEIVKIMHSDADIALIDEPTNFMDYEAKAQFIKWLKSSKEAVLVITHDRDVLGEVDRIIELKDGESFNYRGNYESYLMQNTTRTNSSMNEYEVVQRKIENLKKQISYARSKKAMWSGTADKKNPFVVMEDRAKREIKKLQEIDRPSFWIDKASSEDLDYKDADRYQKYKAKNVRIGLSSGEQKSRRVIASAKELSLGYDKSLFSDVNFDLLEGGTIEIRGRNGAGKTTLIKALLGDESVSIFSGSIQLDKTIQVGIYKQEIDKKYFKYTLEEAIEKYYLEHKIQISTTKIRQLIADYLFTDQDRITLVEKLSGGQKARFQIITMLANNPKLLILDEPTSHLDLPSIEELEDALKKYSGAILYISHDGYFRNSLGGDVVEI